MQRRWYLLIVLGVAGVIALLGLHGGPLPHRLLGRFWDNQEVARLFAEDQADRTPRDGQPLDWERVEPRDRAREARVKALYQRQVLRTGADFYHAAMILQHAPTPEDYLLAHELCIVAISLGEDRALWLAAASEDRFLMSLERPQRFGTQYRSEGADAPLRLYPVAPEVTDDLRRRFRVPPLAEAKAREQELNQPGNERH